MGKISLFLALILLVVIIGLAAGAGFGVYKWWLNHDNQPAQTSGNGSVPDERVPKLQPAIFTKGEVTAVYFELPVESAGGYINYVSNSGILVPGAKVYRLQSVAGAKKYVPAQLGQLKENQPILIDVGPNPHEPTQPLVYAIYQN